MPLGGLPAAARLEHPITTYRTTASAVRALGRAVRYAEWLAVGRSTPTRSDPTEAVAGREPWPEDCSTGSPTGGGSTPDEAAALLAGYGIPLLGQTAGSATEAAEVAAGLGFPVAMKVADPEVVHKTDRGLVRIGLRTLAQVRDTYRDFAREVGHAPQVLVQPMAVGAEVALGLVRDPALGAAGHGGRGWGRHRRLGGPRLPGPADRPVRRQPRGPFAPGLAAPRRVPGRSSRVTSPAWRP